MNSWSEWIRRLLVHHDPGDDPWSIDPDPLHPREINPYLLWTGLTLWITTDFLPPCPAKYEQELAFEYLESWKTFYNFWQRNSLLVVEGNVEEGETRQYHDWDFCEFSFAQNTCSTQSNNKGLFLPALCLMFFKFKLLVKEQHNVRRQKEITTLLMVTSRSPCRLKKIKWCNWIDPMFDLSNIYTLKEVATRIKRAWCSMNEKIRTKGSE